MGEWFDGAHVTYIIVSLGVTVLLLYLATRHLKTQRGKDVFLKVFALLTFFLHVSILWHDFLAHGSAAVPDNILFPIYFCNLSMYMLMITAFWGKKDGKAFGAIAIMTAYGGFFGAMISLIYPEYYFGHANIFEWGVIKSMTSHSTMLIGSLWLFLGGYVPIRKKNTFVYFGGLLVYGVIGLGVNAIFAASGLGDPNAMYLSHPPLAEAPFLNCWTIAALMVIVIHLSTLVYERVKKTREGSNLASVGETLRV